MKWHTFFQRLLLVLTAVMALSAVHANAQTKELDVCWKNSFGRGAGLVPESCPPGTERDGALCYPACRTGFAGVGPVCWASCPAGMNDIGAACAKPEPSYGRTAGYLDGNACKRDSAQGCEQQGLLWYPSCRAGYKGAGPVCWSELKCPAGWNDAGLTCTKPTYGRSAGNTMICAPGTVTDAGLCYNSCKAGFDGVGPVCWGQCQAPYNVPCGGLCAVSADACAKATTDIVLASLETIGTVVGTIVTGGAAGAVKAAASTAARIAAKGISAAVAKGAIAKAAAAAGKEYTQIQLENMAKASVGDDFDPAMLDPTGIASLVKAFDKPICNDPSATTKTSTTRPLLNLTALASASFDYIDWDGRRATVTLREPGRASIPRGFWVSAGGAAPREVASIRYTTPDGAKYTAWMTPTGFRHQPQTNVGQVDARTGQALGSHTDSFMHYRSWDGKGYSVNFGALIGKWQIQTL